MSSIGLLLLASLQAVNAQFPPPREGITTVKSPHHEGITISYKEPGICETTPGVRSYSGYIHLPPNSLTEDGEDQNYPINTFFWFFESRKEPRNAPLSIWLNGGPGGSSLLGLLAENGPCFVNSDSNSTTHNPWSWNNEVNMLYIDQPVQVGYSYDTLHNGTKNFSAEDLMGMNDTAKSIELRDFSDGNIPEQNQTFLVGTFSSQNQSFSANTTEHAAVALWHFAQTWFEEFPEYKPHNEKVSLWTESYGGKYGPSFMDFFAQQNDKILNGTIAGPGVHYIHLDTLGIVNGCIDNLYTSLAYAAMAYNNTYGIQAVNETTHHKHMYELHRPGGILDQVKECRRLAEEHGVYGDIEEVNEYCANASASIFEQVIMDYMISGKYGWFDITHSQNDPFPSMYEIGYLNQHWVQAALGVPVNHSWASEAVGTAFMETGDTPRGGIIEDIADLLDRGIKVHMMYGDRDYACSWTGGEASALSIPYKYQEAFSTSGYTALTVSDQPPFVPYGLTRQHGNFSFTRVYQAGHMVPSYQPEASYQIFARSLFNKDIATGKVDLTQTGGWANYEEDDIFKTEGPLDTWWKKNEIMPAPEPECYVLVPSTCTQEKFQAVRNGTAIVKNWIVVGMEGKQSLEEGEVKQAEFYESQIPFDLAEEL